LLLSVFFLGQCDLQKVETFINWRLQLMVLSVLVMVVVEQWD